MAKRIITGFWDNEPIWRYETAEEQLFQELARRNEKIVEKLKKENEETV